MNPVQVAIDEYGGPSKVAQLLGVSVQAVCFWRDGKRSFPVEHCATIAKHSNGKVHRWDLRPDDWFSVWPELVGTRGAPRVPAAEVRG
jgi:DNA-binding transcriptional regulator YdaS (Cro superfamily)